MTGHSESNQPTDDESWVTVRRFSTLDDAYDHGLVVLAMGEDCRVEQEPDDNTFILQTEDEPSLSLEKELDAFTEETIAATAPREHPEFRTYPAGWAWYFAWAIALIATYYWQGSPNASVDRYVSSSIDLIRYHEWWRPFTSLFLHADLPHLVGNLLVGLGFTIFVAHSIGAWKAWTLILLSGALGNALNSWIQYPEAFRSLGASTAVFAALGLLSGVGVMQSWRMRPHWSWAKIAGPLLAGLVLLGMLGASSDPRTDVLGHACGFVAGLGAGVIAGHFERAPQS